MEIAVTLRHVEPNEELKKYAEQKIGRIKKFFDHGVKAEVILSMEKKRFLAEVNKHPRKISLPLLTWWWIK